MLLLLLLLLLFLLSLVSLFFCLCPQGERWERKWRLSHTVIRRLTLFIDRRKWIAELCCSFFFLNERRFFFLNERRDLLFISFFFGCRLRLCGGRRHFCAVPSTRKKNRKLQRQNYKKNNEIRRNQNGGPHNEIGASGAGLATPATAQGRRHLPRRRLRPTSDEAVDVDVDADGEVDRCCCCCCCCC